MGAVHQFEDDDEEIQPLVLASEQEMDANCDLREECDRLKQYANDQWKSHHGRSRREEDSGEYLDGIIAFLKALLFMSVVGACFGMLSIRYCRNTQISDETNSITRPSLRERWCQSYLHSHDPEHDDDDAATDYFDRDSFYRFFYDEDRPPEDEVEKEPPKEKVMQLTDANDGQPNATADSDAVARAETPTVSEPPVLAETRPSKDAVEDEKNENETTEPAATEEENAAEGSGNDDGVIVVPSESPQDTENEKPYTIEEALQQLNNFLDMPSPLTPVQDVSRGTPVFWHIPKAAGSTMKEMLTVCHQLVLSTEFGVTDGHDKDEALAVVYPTIHSPGTPRNPYLNVDTTSKTGIERAIRLGFPAHTNMLDAVTVRYLYHGNDLFSSDQAKGRLFAIFRHPVQRAISMFYYLQRADWEETYHPEFKSWNLTQYAQSRWIEGDWMTRMLVRDLEGDLTEEQFQIARTILRRKFLVGLVSQLDKSVSRMERWFGWKYRVHPANQEACRAHLLEGGENVGRTTTTSSNENGNDSRAGEREHPEEGSEVWNMIAAQNKWDIRLYESVVQLFAEQAQLFENVPPNFRHLNATCCECDPPTYPSPPHQYQCPQKVYDK